MTSILQKSSFQIVIRFVPGKKHEPIFEGDDLIAKFHEVVDSEESDTERCPGVKRSHHARTLRDNCPLKIDAENRYTIPEDNFAGRFLQPIIPNSEKLLAQKYPVPEKVVDIAKKCADIKPQEMESDDEVDVPREKHLDETQASMAGSPSHRSIQDPKFHKEKEGSRVCNPFDVDFCRNPFASSLLQDKDDDEEGVEGAFQDRNQDLNQNDQDGNVAPHPSEQLLGIGAAASSRPKFKGIQTTLNFGPKNFSVDKVRAPITRGDIIPHPRLGKGTVTYRDPNTGDICIKWPGNNLQQYYTPEEQEQAKFQELIDSERNEQDMNEEDEVAKNRAANKARMERMKAQMKGNIINKNASLGQDDDADHKQQHGQMHKD